MLIQSSHATEDDGVGWEGKAKAPVGEVCSLRTPMPSCHSGQSVKAITETVVKPSATGEEDGGDVAIHRCVLLTFQMAYPSLLQEGSQTHRGGKRR